MEVRAEVRRLQPGGRAADQADREAEGISRNTVQAARRSDGPVVVRAGVGRIGGRCVRAADPGTVGVVPGDAGVGDREPGGSGMAVLGADPAGARRGVVSGYLLLDPALRTAYMAWEIAQDDFRFPM